MGTATSIVRDVRQAATADFQPLREGDSVYQNHRIRTAQDSSAVLTMADVTRVAIGPVSEIVLDQFFVGSGTPAIAVTRGMFRFVSGPGGSGVHYRVRTPHASIAVRGTRFDVRVANGMTTIVLLEGAVDVCRNEAGGSCRSLAPGQALDVSANGIYPPTHIAPGDWTFEAGRGSAQTRAALALGRAVASAPPRASWGAGGSSITADASDPLFGRPNRDSNRSGFSAGPTREASSPAASAAASPSSDTRAAAAPTSAQASAAGSSAPAASGSGDVSSSASVSSSQAGGTMSAQSVETKDTRTGVAPSKTDGHSGSGLGNVTVTINAIK